MQSRQYPLVFLTTTLLVTLTSKIGSAFTITGQPGLEPANFSSLSIFGERGKGLTTLDSFDSFSPSSYFRRPGEVTQIRRGGTDGLRRNLRSYERQGWSFLYGNNLRGRFDISQYYACNVVVNCGFGTDLRSRTGGVGSAFQLNYRPRGNDPRPGNANQLYWIQRVITNYAADTPLGIRVSFIDNIGGGTDTPYYGRGRPLNQVGRFSDRPYRQKILNQDYYWFAELYLAQQIGNTKTVKIYNGIRWGWKYDYEPTPYRTFFASNSIDVASINNDANKIEEQEPSSFDSKIEEQEASSFDSNGDSQTPRSVPEHTGGLGILAWGGWLACLRFRRRKNQQP